MKTIILILAIALIPFYSFSQKGHGKGHGNGNGGKEKSYKGGNKSSKKSAVVVSPRGQSGVVYKEKKRHGPPSWAPAHGYRHRHVYFPAYKCYYDTYNGVYIYLSGTRWVTAISPPTFMLNVNLSSARKVELNIDDVPKPQIYFEQHVVLYPPFP